MRPKPPLWWLARQRWPILVGPWTSEMGFEALYWLPFLAQLCVTYDLAPSQLIPVTRGGAGAWYPAGSQPVELYDYVPARDLRLLALDAGQKKASIKQLGVTDYERQLLRLIAARLGLRRYGVLHPSRMYRALDRFWGSMTMGLADAMTHLRVEPFPAIPVPLGMALPERYVVVRWYQRVTWPMLPSLVEWTHSLVRSLATTIPVVILTASQYLDDHVDFPVPTGPGITVVRPEPWQRNLAIQTAVVQRAAAFVGTWGGLAQLAVRCRIPTVAFYDRWQGCSYQHLVLTQWLAVQYGVPCIVGRPIDIEQVRAILPVAVALPDPPRGSSS